VGRGGGEGVRRIEQKGEEAARGPREWQTVSVGEAGRIRGGGRDEGERWRGRKGRVRRSEGRIGGDGEKIGGYRVGDNKEREEGGIVEWGGGYDS